MYLKGYSIAIQSYEVEWEAPFGLLALKALQIYIDPPVLSTLTMSDRWEAFTNILKNIARIAKAVPVTLYSRVTVNVEIVVLNCQKCNQCLDGCKSLGMFFEGVLQLSWSLSF